MERLTTLLAQLKEATLATKVTIAVSVAALLLLVGFATWSASEPHYVIFKSSLDASQAAACGRALSEGGVRYRVSQPPGPFVIWVDEGEEYEAQNLVALAGALAPKEEGISTSSSGAADAFRGATERLLIARKREWQECEKQLEALEFVSRATVNASAPEVSTFRRGAPPTVSVTLTLHGGRELRREQAEAVARITQLCFNVPRENVGIFDQAGRILFDGADLDGLGRGSDELFAHKRRYDDYWSGKANEMLERAYGPGRAWVSVDSTWSFDSVESFSEKLDTEQKLVTTETSSTTSTPVGGVSLANSAGGAGGYAGTASNLGGQGNEPAQSAPVEAPVAKTSDSTKHTVVPRSTEHRLNNAPQLEGLGIALLVDQSLADEIEALEGMVKAAVRFDAERGDVFDWHARPFATIERDEEGNPLPPKLPEPVEEPNPWLQLGLEHGVEVVAALAFLIVLMKSLKTVRSTVSGGGAKAGRRESGAEQEVDPELLARMQIEELLDKDPERVGEILSRWAAGELQSAGAGK